METEDIRNNDESIHPLSEPIPPPEVVELDAPPSSKDEQSGGGIAVMLADMRVRIGVLCVAAVAVVIALIAIFSGADNPPYEVVQSGRYDQVEYIATERFLVQRGNSWGIVNTRGRQIINFGMYDSIVDVVDDYALVSLGSGRATNFYLYDLSNGRQRASFTRYDSVRMVTPNRFIVESGGRAGVVNARGRDVIRMGLFDNITPIDYGDFYLVRSVGRLGLVDARGREVASLGSYESITRTGRHFLVSSGGRVGVLDNRGRETIGLGQFDRLWYAGYDRFLAEDRGRMGVVDSRGREVLPMRYDNIRAAGELFIVSDAGRVGVVDNRGRVVIAMGTYTEIWADSDHLAVVTEDAHMAMYDSRGRVVFPAGRYQYIEYAGDGRFMVASGDFREMNIGVVNARGGVIIPMGRYDDIELTADGGFIVYQGARVGAYNARGREVIPLGRYDRITEIIDNYAFVRRDGRVSVVNTRRNPR